MGLEILDGINGFQIKQSRQWLESFTGFEAANAYAITDDKGRAILAAKEEGGGLIARWFLKDKRPFKINAYTSSGIKVLEFDRPFKFIRHTMEVNLGDGSNLGRIDWSFSLIRKKFGILDKDGNHKYKLQTSPLSPWTFAIKNEFDQKVGTMSKKWSGLGLEMFTTSDNFGIILDVEIPNEDKALLIGSIILGDFIHFEDKD